MIDDSINPENNQYYEEDFGILKDDLKNLKHDLKDDLKDFKSELEVKIFIK